jgi:hypothetical protein
MCSHGPRHRSLQQAVGGSTLIIFSICGFLVLARVFLESRAFVPPRNYLLEFFRLLDGIYTEMNQVTGGIVLTKDVDMLPGTAAGCMARDVEEVAGDGSLSVPRAGRAGTAVVVDVSVNPRAERRRVGRRGLRAAVCACGEYRWP